MTPGARAAAAITILDRVLSGEPAERALTNWGRVSRFAGSGDRAAVRDIVFDALRRKRSAAALGGGMTGRGLVLGLCRESGQEMLFSGEGHAPLPPGPLDVSREPEAEERLDFPAWLIADLEQSLGQDFEAVAAAMRSRAPVFLRVNLRKTDLASAIRSLGEDGIETRPHSLATTALEVVGNARKLNGAAAYLRGLVELQDAASQAVVDCLPLTDGLRVLDLCAGGGGKTLAMAARARITAFAHDALPGRMADLPTRAIRAGAEVTVIDAPEPQAPFDLVLTDVPCSGSGSWRRDPEGKWALRPVRLLELLQIQAAILDRAAAMVEKKGWLAYATCSLLSRENQDQIVDFRTRHPGWDLVREQVFTPLSGGDGFYVAILQRQEKPQRNLDGN